MYILLDSDISHGAVCFVYKVNRSSGERDLTLRENDAK
jgi:hypothetical protein